MAAVGVTLLLILTFGYDNVLRSSANQTPVAFTFKEYQYKDSPKNVGLTS